MAVPVVSVLAMLLVCFAFAMAVMSVLVMAFVLAAMVLVAVVVLVAVLAASLRPGWLAASFMPHFGQRSGLSLVTSGCIGQT